MGVTMKAEVYVVGGLLLVQALGQDLPLRSFEVASIKPADPSDPSPYGWIDRDPGLVHYTHVSLQNLLAQAYRIKNAQISGPNWLDSDRFDIAAKMPPGTTPDDLPSMLRTLLAERFELRYHTETKTVSGYSLTVAKGGPKLVKADGDAGDISTDSVTARRRIKGNIGMTYLAGLLANMVDRPVVDETGIKGVYRIDLVWSEDGSTDSSAAEDFPSLFTALRSTLGLGLESRRIPVDIYVIDHVDRVPVAN